MASLTVSPKGPPATFLDVPLALDLERLDAEIAVIGVPYGNPYNIDEVANDQSRAPTAIRRASELISTGWDRWDFDVDGLPLRGKAIRVVDCGDVPGDARDLDLHYRNAESAVRKILGRGALPIVMGGDHGITIPVLRGYQDHGPITVVQIDAHIDWRDDKFGVPTGYSSPMRRASEMAHVSSIFQVGLRGQGSARAEEVAAARSYGAALISASDVHEKGIKPVLDAIPEGGRYYITVDGDAFDPSVMPGVAGPVPGGLTFHQVQGLITGCIRKGRMVGLDIVELAPARDLNGISAITMGRLMLVAIGAAAAAGYFEPP
ncbi:MAG: agmatinase [Parvibaculaceae bacterium]